MGSACSHEANAAQAPELTVAADGVREEAKQREAPIVHAEPPPPGVEAQSPKAPAAEEAAPAGGAEPAEPQGLLAAAAHGVQQAAEAVHERIEQAVEAAQGGAEAKAEAEVKAEVEVKAEAEAEVRAPADVERPPAAPAPAVVPATKDAVHKAEVHEIVAPLMGAATAAAAGMVTVSFAAGREKKVVEFNSKDLGFVCARAGGGCCVGGAARGKVLVGRVDAKKHAEKLGVKRGWVLKAVNGTEVTGLEQVEKLLKEATARLPEVAP